MDREALDELIRGRQAAIEWHQSQIKILRSDNIRLEVKRFNIDRELPINVGDKVVITRALQHHLKGRRAVYSIEDCYPIGTIAEVAKVEVWHDPVTWGITTSKYGTGNIPINLYDDVRRAYLESVNETEA